MNIAETLSGGDRRSIGRTKDVVSYVLKHKSALEELVQALDHSDAVVRMRAADALEKVSVDHAEWLNPFARTILSLAVRSHDQEILWHAAQILPRLHLPDDQRRKAYELLLGLLGNKSRIVHAFALTGLVDFSEQDVALREEVTRLVKDAEKSEIPSLAARARKLRKRLDG